LVKEAPLNFRSNDIKSFENGDLQNQHDQYPSATPSLRDSVAPK
jgi:hypothetical protein